MIKSLGCQISAENSRFGGFFLMTYENDGQYPKRMLAYLNENDKRVVQGDQIWDDAENHEHEWEATPGEFAEFILQEESRELLVGETSPYLEQLRRLRYRKIGVKPPPPTQGRDTAKEIAAAILKPMMSNTKVFKRLKFKKLDKNRAYSTRTKAHIVAGNERLEELADDNLLFGCRITHQLELFVDGFPVSEFQNDIRFSDSFTSIYLLMLLREVRQYVEDGLEDEDLDSYVWHIDYEAYSGK
jgi:hypothetical protein